MEKKSGIYKITNTCNGKFYIGSSCELKKRKYSHFNSLKRNKHDNDILQKSFNKYGKENFKFEIIEFVEDNNKLLEREQHYLDTLKPWDRKIGYNILKIAGSSTGRKATPETVEKLRQSHLGYKQSTETIYKRFKNGVSDETRQKMSNARAGKECSELTKQKISDKAKKKGVINLDTNKCFNSIMDAGRYYGLAISHISNVCQGKRKTTGGFHWQYI